MSPEDKPRWTKRKLIRGLILAIGTLFVLYILGFVALYFYYKHKIFGDFSPATREIFEKWRTEKLFFPEEALEAQTFSDETIMAAKEFNVQWKQYEKEAQEIKVNFKSLVEPDARSSTPTAELRMLMEKFDKYSPMDKEKKESTPVPGTIPELFPKVREFDPLIRAFEKVVSQRDYEMDAFAEGIEPSNDSGLPLPDFLTIQTVSYLTWLKSLALIHEKDFQSALHYASLNFKASRVHPYSSVISRLIGIAVLKNAVKNMNSLILECNDREILQSALKIQNQSLSEPSLIREYAFPSTDWLGGIRQAKRKGIDVRIQGLTAQEIFMEWLLVQDDYKERFVLPRIHDEEARKEIMKSIKSTRNNFGVLSGKTRITRGFYKGILTPMIASSVFFSAAVPSYQEAHVRENYTKSLLDLLAVETSSKLYQTERGAPPNSLNDLVPDYLEKEPLDRFQEKAPYLFHEYFYSIGPDGVDQNRSIPYDPTNGALSSGDVSLY